MSPLSVNHNLMAYGVSRQLSAHYDSLADSVRRLSTGQRVDLKRMEIMSPDPRMTV